MAKTPRASASTRRTTNKPTTASSRPTPDYGVMYGAIERGHQPNAYFPTTKEEYELIATVVASGWQAGKSVLKHFQGSKDRTPLAVMITRSEPLTASYRLDFKFVNTSPHSLYIEDLLLLDPEADPTKIRYLDFSIHETSLVGARSPGPTFDTFIDAEKQLSTSSVRKPPFLVKSGDTSELTLIVKRDAKLWFDTAKVGIARASVSFLAQEKRETVAWRFLIRHK